MSEIASESSGEAPAPGRAIPILLYHSVADQPSDFIGTLRDGIDANTAADLIWALNDATLYHSLVHVRHWSHDKVQAWRPQTWKSQLLPDEPRPAATGRQDEHPVLEVDTGL